MSNTLVLDTKKYAIYVKVLAGEGDGILVTIDASGHIHIGPGDPAGLNAALKEKLQGAARQIEAGADAFNAAMAAQRTRAA